MRGAARAPSTRRAHGRRYVPARPAVAQAGALRPATRANPCFDAYLDNEIAALFRLAVSKICSIPEHAGRSAMHEESKSPPLRGCRKSPLPDSNRRPLLNQCDPNGSRWQPVATVSRQCSHFGASGDPNLCHPLRPLCSMIKTATGGSRWQRSRVSSSHFSAFGEPNLCHRLRPLCSISIPIRPKRAVLSWSSNRNALRREGVFRNRSPASALACPGAPAARPCSGGSGRASPRGPRFTA